MVKKDSYPSEVCLYATNEIKRLIKETNDVDLKIACRRELTRRQGEERNWQFVGPAEHPLSTLHKHHSLHTIQKF